MFASQYAGQKGSRMTILRLANAIAFWFLTLILVLANEIFSIRILEVILSESGNRAYRIVVSIAVVFVFSYYYAKSTAGLQWVSAAVFGSIIWVLLGIAFEILVLYFWLDHTWQTLLDDHQFWHGGFLGSVLLSQVMGPLAFGNLANRASKMHSSPRR